MPAPTRCGSPPVDAAIAAADRVRASPRAPRGVESANHAALRARDAGAPLVESVALDCLCARHLEHSDLADALDALRRRGEVLETLPLDASTGFQFNDFLLMASEVHLAAGNLALAAHYADTLAGLACYHEQDHLAVARRIKVDAMSGHLEAATARGDRFLAAWERAGRPSPAPSTPPPTRWPWCTACSATSAAVADGQTSPARSCGDPALLEGCATGWAPTLDALVFLHRDRPDLAVERLSADIDDPDIWAGFTAPLGGRGTPPCGPKQPSSATTPTPRPGCNGASPPPARTRSPPPSSNAPATSLTATYDTLPTHARTFAELGCVYQQRRTETLREDPALPVLADRPHARSSRGSGGAPLPAANDPFDPMPMSRDHRAHHRDVEIGTPAP